MANPSDRAPVSLGDSYHIEIEELGSEGDGIGYVEDFVVIVPDSTLGESVTVEVDRIEDHYAMASRIEGPET